MSAPNDSVMMIAEPFSVLTTPTFTPDHQTRLIVLTYNMELRAGESSPVITAQAKDSQQRIFPLVVEAVRKVPDFEWITQVVVKLPRELENAGDVSISVNLRGVQSKSTPIYIVFIAPPFSLLSKTALSLLKAGGACFITSKPCHDPTVGPLKKIKPKNITAHAKKKQSSEMIQLKATISTKVINGVLQPRKEHRDIRSRNQARRVRHVLPDMRIESQRYDDPRPLGTSREATPLSLLQQR